MASPEDINYLKRLIEASLADYRLKEKSSIVGRQKEAILKLTLLNYLRHVLYLPQEEIDKEFGPNDLKEQLRHDYHKNTYDAIDNHSWQVLGLVQKALAEEELRDKSVRGKGNTLGRVGSKVRNPRQWEHGYED